MRSHLDLTPDIAVIMASSPQALIDLETVHNATELRIGQRFSTGKDATMFMQDWCFNNNKKCVVNSSGKCKTYTCDSQPCPWMVTVIRRGDKAGGFHMAVSKIEERHGDLCMSAAVPTQRQIQLLPAFMAAVQGNRKTKRKALVALVQSRDKVNLQGTKSKLYRAKDAVIAELDGEWEQSFSYIPALLSDIRDKNPGTTVRLDVDQHNRFLRAFLAIGANVRSQSSLVPLLGFDGAHTKHPHYKGVVLSMLGRDGNGQNVTMAVALVNAENESNVLWFMELCVEAGIFIQDRAVFCDRGKIRGAVARLYQARAIAVELRFCTVHIMRNLNRQFKLNGREFENMIWAIQGAATQIAYEGAVETVRAKYAKVVRSNGKSLGDEVVAYIRDINPVHWTVHANMAGFVPDEDPGTAVPPRPRPLFGWRSTNFVESDNQAMLQNGIREAGPQEMFIQCVVAEMDRWSARHDLVSKWLEDGRCLTPFAKTEWDKQRSRLGEYHVRRSVPTVYFVGHPGSTSFRRVELVDSEKPICTCPTFDQHRLACRHIAAVLKSCGRPELCMKAFHHAYLVSTYAAVFHNTGIEVPLKSSLKEDPSVQPCPSYKQVGRPVINRIASAGETTTTKATYSCRTCKGTGHNRSTCSKHSSKSATQTTALVPKPVPLDGEKRQLPADVLPARTPPTSTPPTSTRPPDAPPGSTTHNRLSMAFLLG